MRWSIAHVENQFPVVTAAGLSAQHLSLPRGSVRMGQGIQPSATYWVNDSGICAKKIPRYLTLRIKVGGLLFSGGWRILCILHLPQIHVTRDMNQRGSDTFKTSAD